jgi:hypothetical protein
MGAHGRASSVLRANVVPGRGKNQRAKVKGQKSKGKGQKKKQARRLTAVEQRQAGTLFKFTIGDGRVDTRRD